MYKPIPIRELSSLNILLTLFLSELLSGLPFNKGESELNFKIDLFLSSKLKLKILPKLNLFI